MTDARYLVPETCLPFMPPNGWTVWLDGKGRPTTWPTGEALHGFASLDLSRPDERDGIPVRLDVLPWALAVLAKRVGIAIDDIDAIRPNLRPGAETWSVYGFGGRCVTILTPEDPGWEDYDPADPHQPRRIVAAVLRNHKEPTP